MWPGVLLYHVPAYRFVVKTWESGTTTLDSIVPSCYSLDPEGIQ